MQSSANKKISPSVQLIFKKLSEDIKFRRKERKWTQAEIAKRARISIDTVKRIEKGDPSVMASSYFSIIVLLGGAKAQEDVLGFVNYSKQSRVKNHSPFIPPDLAELLYR